MHLASVGASAERPKRSTRELSLWYFFVEMNIAANLFLQNTS
jgi:hypothetical protein